MLDKKDIEAIREGEAIKRLPMPKIPKSGIRMRGFIPFIKTKNLNWQKERLKEQRFLKKQAEAIFMANLVSGGN